ncbi:amino acid adenylation domain-containing protein [Streptomyces sp. NBC_00523]|uniref:non-ribosomal peptide synthetase n=2 Tax=unclassified Streptomyces TaxID=2593676 RepID=UPI002E81FB61|nr:amino acid adenylation domain-containing protein [Streptomyces sp. NBC_00523]WUC98217.1 amino acid adenylation domain-containing protein [Streptomyces sp. NBC_00523]
MNATLSSAQHGVWLTERTLDTASAYHLTLALCLDGPLDTSRLNRACAAVAAQHPALTTVFAADGTPRPGPGPGRPRTVECTDGTLDALLARERAQPFDLAHGPLHRFALLRLSPVRHVLVLTAHHLVFDGESKDRLVDDLATAYRGGPPAPAAPQPAAAPSPDALADAEAYWATRWRDPAAPALPGLTVPPVAGTAPAPGAEITWSLGPERAALLGATAERLGLTRFELLTASWHALLARYGEAAPVTAIELSLRTPGTATGVGLAVNELPLFTTADLDAPFATWSRTVRAELRALYRHRAVPLGRSVRGLTPRTALTPLSLSYRRRPERPRPDFGAEVRAEVRWLGFCGTARNLAHLQLVDSGTEVEASLQFRAAALTADGARRIADHWTTLLDGVLAGPDTPVGDLPLLTPGERAAQLAAPSPRPELTRRTVPSLFAEAVAARPDATAVVRGDETLTYRELSALVAHAAAALARHGAGPGTLVGIELPRGRDQLVVLLASLALGSVHLPLDPDHPAERLAFLRADSRLALRVTTRPEGPGDLTPEALAPVGPDTPALPPGPTPAHPAYVLYTSGSTGRPKGVEVPHSALANVLGALRDHLGSGPDDRWLGLTSLSFDISAVELLLPLISGGRVVLVPEGGHRDGPALLGLIDHHRVTHVQATPSGWRLLLDAGLGDDAAGLTALSGGEALPPALAAELGTVSKRLVNVYGPTETTIWSTLAEPAVGDDGQVLIGEPLANTRAYVLDGRLRPVPYGLPGELYLGGAGLAHGYRHRPGLTATRFVPDPYGPAGARLYRTGDLVRRLPDGGLVCIGRSDNQVKVRGHRIELGEIEARLASHPSVAQAAAAVHGADGERRLSAYVVPAGPAPTAQELHAHLAAALPAAAVPATYTVLEAFPLTPNGKLDRAALPEPVPARGPAPGGGAGTGSDPTIDAVLAIWREVLELDDLGCDEDLFDLGGHSLTITAIAARIHRTLGVDLPFDVFFDAPTVRGIAAAVTALRKE